MTRYAGLLWTSLALLLAAVLFFALSVAGMFWAKATPLTDIGLYAVTITLVLFGLGGLFLRSAKIHPRPDL
jgi:hypothetical protein